MFDSTEVDFDWHMSIFHGTVASYHVASHGWSFGVQRKRPAMMPGLSCVGGTQGAFHACKSSFLQTVGSPVVVNMPQKCWKVNASAVEFFACKLFN